MIDETTLNEPRWRPRFTIRAVLVLTLMIALLLGWRSSLQHARNQVARQANQLRYAEQELARARNDLEARPTRDKARVFWSVELDGTSLRSVTIASPANAFQKASFQDCDLRDATLQAGNAAFQASRFDQSRLVNAKLTGGGSSFQGASFVKADLTGAILTGGGASFQGASFEDATLVRARLTGSFQSVNISGAHFEGADLSALDSASLASCYFKEPPTYDTETQFPDGFDPAAHQWIGVTQ